MNHTQKKRPTIAKEWQLAVLKKLQSESSNPTEGQRSAAAAETGLDEKWVRNWFTRQRSKLASRGGLGQAATTEPRQPRDYSPTVSTFRLQLCYPPVVPSGQQDLSSRRPAPTPIDPGPVRHPTDVRQPSRAGLDSRSSRTSRSTANAQAIFRSRPSVSVAMHLSNSSQNPALVPYTTSLPTYSRDPLRNRYPDFSQFFHPQVYERFRSSELWAPINDHDHLPVNSNMDSHAPRYFQGLFNSLGPHPGGLPTYQDPSASLQSCPIAFSMRLVDLLGHL